MLLYNFNAVAFSDSNRPLPISGKERAKFCTREIFSAISTLRSVSDFKFERGSLFLTNLRIIFIPDIKNSFESFYIPLKRILNISQNQIKFMCEDNSLGIFSFDGQDQRVNILLLQLKDIMSSIVIEAIEDHSDEDIPHYFEFMNQ